LHFDNSVMYAGSALKDWWFGSIHLKENMLINHWTILWPHFFLFVYLTTNFWEAL